MIFSVYLLVLSFAHVSRHLRLLNRIIIHGGRSLPHIRNIGSLRAWLAESMAQTPLERAAAPTPHASLGTTGRVSRPSSITRSLFPSGQEKGPSCTPAPLDLIAAQQGQYQAGAETRAPKTSAPDRDPHRDPHMVSGAKGWDWGGVHAVLF
ncbi:hypothetical protein NQZ68_033870 [Dissostichus eleginoides]|nr:hypothetical protein NQZ68_033870 [Dissostichus eleginoides]